MCACMCVCMCVYVCVCVCDNFNTLLGFCVLSHLLGPGGGDDGGGSVLPLLMVSGAIMRVCASMCSYIMTSSAPTCSLTCYNQLVHTVSPEEDGVQMYVPLSSTFTFQMMNVT